MYDRGRTATPERRQRAIVVATAMALACVGWLGSVGCKDSAGMEKALRAQKKAERTGKAETPKNAEKNAQARSRIARMPAPSKLLDRARKHFSPLPAFAPEHPDNPISSEKIELGKRLFYDPGLSAPGDRSCASCHPLHDYGAAVADLPQIGEASSSPRRAPSVYNAAFSLSQYWDGRARDLEEQATMALFNEDEMGWKAEPRVVAKLQRDKSYVQQFRAAFPREGINAINIGRAIAAFERQLITPGPFDDFLRGDVAALDDGALHGLHLFMKNGCANCHNGPLVGGGMYQKLGVYKPWNTPDLGRYGVTRGEQDRYLFKVASLRNVTKTAPYLHDGSIEKLENAVTAMHEHQTKSTLEKGDLSSFIAFLGALEGRIPAALGTAPAVEDEADHVRPAQ